MTKSKAIRVPVSEDEKKKLNQEARKAGYMSLAAYLRDKGLNRQKQD